MLLRGAGPPGAGAVLQAAAAAPVVSYEHFRFFKFLD